METEIDLKAGAAAVLTCPFCTHENALTLRACDTMPTPEPDKGHRAVIDLCSCRACIRACYFVHLDLDMAGGVRRRMFGPFVHGETGPSGNLWRNAAAALIGRVWPLLTAENQ